MKYKIKRHSESRSGVQPCDGALFETVLVKDRRDKPSVALTKPEQASWFGRGINHREDGDFLYRDIPTTGWYVEFDTADEILVFVLTVGSVMLKLVNGEYELEIYDEYRE